ncbi:MAG: hypothetical protein CMP22_05020 [Rickettsiales bacterium]|nr:hypothetical protein [Rickettsiales bacterium]
MILSSNHGLKAINLLEVVFLLRRSEHEWVYAHAQSGTGNGLEKHTINLAHYDQEQLLQILEDNFFVDFNGQQSLFINSLKYASHEQKDNQFLLSFKMASQFGDVGVIAIEENKDLKGFIARLNKTLFGIEESHSRYRPKPRKTIQARL